MANDTWTLCRPVHHNVVRNKCAFKINQKLGGSIDRYKAKLVAKGFDHVRVGGSCTSLRFVHEVTLPWRGSPSFFFKKKRSVGWN
jgi:hypothetical protein